jgi:TPR repeat protein/serine/threonine protein kinase
MLAPGASVAPGDLIDGRYLVESRIGSGGMAVVHRARHLGTGAVCALKLVHPHLVPRRELLDLFLREARVGGRIGKSPHIVEVLDAGFDAELGVPYLVMDLLQGETLEERLAREGPVPPPLLAVFFEQIADALDQAHGAGVVHRDLKPSNLFVTRGPRPRAEPCVKVMDFGIAKVLEGSAQHTATQIGTPAYAAPEQMGAAMRAAAARQGITVAASVSPATDVWALGLLAYELATGLPAAQFWGAETTVEIPIKAVLFAHEAASTRAGERASLLPAGFDAWFARATHADAAERWPSAGLAVAELVRLLDVAPAEPVVTSAPAPAAASPYAPGMTEIVATPPPGPLSSVAWAEGTPPPPSTAARSGPLPAPAGARGRFGISGPTLVLLAGSLVAALALVGVGLTMLFAPRAPHAARDVCASIGDRCDEACEAGDAASCGRLAARHERGSGVPRDEARAASLYERACDAADPAGCAGLGRFQRLGRGGLARDPTRATQLFQKACNLDGPPSDGGPPRPTSPRGCALLGESYRDGAGGLSRDDGRALALFRDACTRGDPTGCKDLGGMYQSGRGGLPRDEGLAAARYREACDGGELLGCNDLGVLVGSGRGGQDHDERLAADLYRRACDGGETLGCDNLAWMLEHGKGGLGADPARAAALYREACDGGDARGCGNLGVMFEQGKGGLAADPARAAALYQEACTAGDAHACDNLGTMLESGKGSLPRDEARAAALYRGACDSGDADACQDLGHLHEAGRGGLSRDDARALALYERACDGGSLRGCVNLGVLLAAGRGALRDEVHAVALWQRACDGGVASGCADLGWAYFLGHGVRRALPKARELLRRACTDGSAWGCDRLDESEGRFPRGQPPPKRR